MRERIVYRHPKGRFEVVETIGTNMMGNTYRFREAVLTPEKDERGLLTNTAMPAPVLWDRPEPQQDKLKTMRGGVRKKLTDEEKNVDTAAFCGWYDHEADCKRDRQDGFRCAQLSDGRGQAAQAETAASVDG